MKFICQIHFFFFVNLGCIAQINKEENSYDIQDVAIENTFVYSLVNNFIIEQRTLNPLFKEGYGYVTLEQIKFLEYKTFIYNKEKRLVNKQDSLLIEQPLLTFKISLNSYLINGSDEKDCMNCNYFPPLYTFIDNTLVLIYDDTFRWLFPTNNKKYSTRSKYRLCEYVKMRLNKSLDEDFLFYDPFKNKSYSIGKNERRNLSEDKIMSLGAFTLHAAQRVNILRNGDVKIEKID